MALTTTMTTYFISDLHLTPTRPVGLKLFQDFLAQQAPDVDSLYILGDLFEFWIGDDAAVQLGADQCLSALRQLSDQGLNLYFMSGNRDFLIGEQFADTTGCQLLNEPTVIELDGQPVLLLHGDSLCTDDIEHQSFRKTVDDPKWRQQFLAMTIEQRLAMAQDARNQSQLHQMAVSMEIMDVTQSAVKRAMTDAGVSTLIHGHTHRPAVHEFNLNGNQAKRIVLGDWYQQSSWLVVDEQGYHLTIGDQVITTVVD